MDFKFSKKELIHLTISILVLTLVFAYDDQANILVLSHWFLNFFRVLIFVTASIFAREIVVKYFAKRHDATSEYELWGISKFWFTIKNFKPFPIGILLAALVTLISRGQAYFTAVGIHNVQDNLAIRTGRKKFHLNYFEEAQIAASGIMTSLFLSVLVLLVGNAFGLNVINFVWINFYLALINMIPISNLDGSKIFFGSLFFYMFTLIFISLGFLLIQTTIFWGLLVAFLVACVLTLWYFYSMNK
jgi:hypothetical protein